jgi:hypothetical protein
VVLVCGAGHLALAGTTVTSGLPMLCGTEPKPGPAHKEEGAGAFGRVIKMKAA